MTIDEYAQKLLERNKEYPWIKEGKFIVPQRSDELLRMRQEYFLESMTRVKKRSNFAA